MDLAPTHQLSSPEGSHAVIEMSNLSFAGVLKAPFNTSGCIVDFYNNSMQSARDDTRLKTAVWQQVSLSCRTLCPILLRQITHNYHRVEGCAPFQSQSVCVALLTHTMCASFAVRSRREQSPHTSEGAASSILHVSSRFKEQCSPSLRPPSNGVPSSASVCRAARPARVLSASTALIIWAQDMVVFAFQFTGGSGVRSPVGTPWARPSGIDGTARIKASTRDYRCVYGALNSRPPTR